MGRVKFEGRTVCIVISACAFLCAAGCSNLLNSKNSSTASGNGPVKVSVDVSVGDARAAYPSTLTGISELKATAADSSGTYGSQTATAEVTDGSAGSLNFSLMPCSWTITVDGMYSDGTTSTILLTGSTAVTISANTDSTVAVKLLPVSQTTITTGNVALSFYDDDSLNFTKVTAALNSVDGTNMGGTSSAATIDGKTCYTYSLSNYTAGAYTIVFAFLKNETTVGYYIDKVVVEPGLTTDKWYVTSPGGTTACAYMTMTSSNVLSETAATSTVYVSGSGGVLGGGVDSNSGTFARPLASLSAALGKYYSGTTSSNPFKIILDGTVTLSGEVETLTQDMYVKFMPLARSTADAVIAVGGEYGIEFVSDNTETSASYTAEITLDGISFTGYTRGAVEASGSKMMLTVQDCTFTPSSSVTAADTFSIEPVVNKFILNGTNTFNSSPVNLAKFENCSTSADSSNSFITLGTDISVSADSIPVYINGVSGSDTQKIVVKSGGTALTSTELAYFSVTPSSCYYLALSSDGLYAYLVGSSTATVTATLDTPLSTVYAVPYQSTDTAATIAQYISDGAVTLSAGSTIYAAAVQVSGTTYSVLSGVSSYSMILYDASGVSLSDTYTALKMDSATHSITLPAWMPAGTYYLHTAAKYNNFWYTNTFKITVE